MIYTKRGWASNNLKPEHIILSKLFHSLKGMYRETFSLSLLLVFVVVGP